MTQTVATATAKSVMGVNMSPEYRQQLRDLAHLLCPLKKVVEVNPLSIPRGGAWDSEGNYHDESLRTEHVT